MNDKLHLITLASNGSVDLWQLIDLKIKKQLCVIDLAKHGPVNCKLIERMFQDIVKEHQTILWNSSWCSVDISTGRIQVELEENSCFNAKVYVGDSPECSKLNVGHSVLSLFFQEISKKHGSTLNLRTSTESLTEELIVPSSNSGKETLNPISKVGFSFILTASRHSY